MLLGLFCLGMNHLDLFVPRSIRKITEPVYITRTSCMFILQGPAMNESEPPSKGGATLIPILLIPNFLLIRNVVVFSSSWWFMYKCIYVHLYIYIYTPPHTHTYKYRFHSSMITLNLVRFCCFHVNSYCGRLYWCFPYFLFSFLATYLLETMCDKVTGFGQ